MKARRHGISVDGTRTYPDATQLLIARQLRIGEDASCLVTDVLD